MKVVNRGTKRRKFSRRYSPLTRSGHESPLQIICPYCHVPRTVWYARIPAGAEEHEACLPISCPESRCGVLLWAYVPPAWRAWAELWRPWQALLDGEWSPGGGPEPKPPPSDQRPPPIIPRLSERTMHARHAYYMLGTRRELAAVILRTRTEPAAGLWEGAEVEVADLYLFVPESPTDLAALLDSQPAVAELHAHTPLTPGEPLELDGIPRGLDPDCWWPLQQSHASLDDHHALDEAAGRIDDDTPPDIDIDDDDTEDDWPDIGAAHAIGDPIDAEPIDAVVIEEDAPAVDAEPGTDTLIPALDADDLAPAEVVIDGAPLAPAPLDADADGDGASSPAPPSPAAGPLAEVAQWMASLAIPTAETT